MKEQTALPRLSAAMASAEEIYNDISPHFPQKLLLHGDFHHGNILFAGSSHVIIDPKGVLGDPLFDISCFVLNEAGFGGNDAAGQEKHVEYVMDYLNKHLGYDKNILAKCFFIQSAMSACWSVQDGAKKEEYANLENKVKLAAKIAKVSF